jgi:DNA-binding CsgD family transcriptional regulator
MSSVSNSRGATELKPGQIDCLLLVDNHLTSKEIALRLGISPHTVDQRVRRALRVTGTRSRREAARLVRQWIEAATPHDTPTGEADDSAPGIFGGWALPFATSAAQTNTMGVWQRLFWIAAIAIAAFVASGMYLAGLESLARLLRHS